MFALPSKQTGKCQSGQNSYFLFCAARQIGELFLIATSSSIVTTRPDGARPALHRKGATGGFYVTDEQIDSVLDTKILHISGVGLMDAMDKRRTKEIMQEAKARGCITTLDVFASSPKDFSLIEPLLPFTDYFMPSEEEAMALSGLTNFEKVSSLLLEKGAKAVVLTLGEAGATYRDQKGLSFEKPA
jgi:sugar/nucleoside kinase (ribokinase family)